MFKLNNKGQTLVLFVVTIPIFLFIIVLVVDIGNIIVQKQELNNVNYLATEYGLENISNIGEADIVNMLTLNTKNVSKIEVDINDNMIEITVKKDVEGLITKVININIYEIVSEYKGTIENNNKKIERVK